MGCLLGDEPLRWRRADARVGRPLGALVGAVSGAQGGLSLLLGTTVVV